jgi:hypothetical protein
MLGVAIHECVEGLQFAVRSVDRIGIFAINVGQTDAEVQADFHVIAPHWEIPPREEKPGLSREKM